MNRRSKLRTTSSSRIYPQQGARFRKNCWSYHFLANTQIDRNSLDRFVRLTHCGRPQRNFWLFFSWLGDRIAFIEQSFPFRSFDFRHILWQRKFHYFSTALYSSILGCIALLVVGWMLSVGDGRLKFLDICELCTKLLEDWNGK